MRRVGKVVQNVETPRLETDRLILRPPDMDDCVYIADLANDLEVARNTTGVIHPYALSNAQQFLVRESASDPARNRLLLIEHREFGAMGMVGFHRPGTPFSELGYWLGRTFRGRGFMTEAVHAALDWAGRGWGKRCIGSGHFIDNPASARVLEKAGFLYTGVVEDRYSRGRGCEVATRQVVWLA